MDTRYQTSSGFIRPSYEEFEPKFEWNRDATNQILVLDLPGFKKEYLKVQIDNHGNVKISGARPLQPLDASKWSRFRKDFKVPKTCDASSIRAKFENGSLSIFMPKLEGNKIDEEEDKEEEDDDDDDDSTKLKEKDTKKSDDGTTKDEKNYYYKHADADADADADEKMSGKMELKKKRISRMMVGKGKTAVGTVLILGLCFYFTRWILNKYHPLPDQQVETYYAN